MLDLLILQVESYLILNNDSNSILMNKYLVI